MRWTSHSPDTRRNATHDRKLFTSARILEVAGGLGEKVSRNSEIEHRWITSSTEGETVGVFLYRQQHANRALAKIAGNEHP